MLKNRKKFKVDKNKFNMQMCLRPFDNIVSRLERRNPISWSMDCISGTGSILGSLLRSIHTSLLPQNPLVSNIVEHLIACAIYDALKESIGDIIKIVLFKKYDEKRVSDAIEELINRHEKIRKDFLKEYFGFLYENNWDITIGVLRSKFGVEEVKRKCPSVGRGDLIPVEEWDCEAARRMSSLQGFNALSDPKIKKEFFEGLNVIERCILLIPPLHIVVKAYPNVLKKLTDLNIISTGCSEFSEAVKDDLGRRDSVVLGGFVPSGISELIHYAENTTIRFGRKDGNSFKEIPPKELYKVREELKVGEPSGIDWVIYDKEDNEALITRDREKGITGVILHYRNYPRDDLIDKECIKMQKKYIGEYVEIKLDLERMCCALMGAGADGTVLAPTLLLCPELWFKGKNRDKFEDVKGKEFEAAIEIKYKKNNNNTPKAENIEKIEVKKVKKIVK